MRSGSTGSLWRQFQRRGAWVFIACVVMVPEIAFIVTSSREKQYAATAALLFERVVVDPSLGGSASAPSGDARRQAATNLSLIGIDTIAARAARTLGPPWTTDAVKARIEIEPEGESNLVNVTATTPVPRVTARLANVYASEFVKYRRETDRATIEEQISLLRDAISGTGAGSASADVDALRRREEQLGVSAALQTGGTRVVQRARTPVQAVSPKPKRNLALGLLAGILLGVLLAALRIRTDRRIRLADEAAEIIDRPLLAVFPRVRINRDGVVSFAEFRIASQMLLANLGFFSVDETIDMIVVTSSGPGEGKSTIAMSLALAGAEAGRDVLLLEADLRRPTAAGRLGLIEGEGLSAVLSGATDLARATRTVEVPFDDLGDDRPTVDVLTAGAIPPNPADLLASDRMRTLLSELRERYALVIIDTSPIGIIPDCVPLLTVADGTLVVCRIDHTEGKDLARFAHQMQLSSARVLGLVANAEPDSVSSNYEYYGYRNVSPRTTDPASVA